MAAQRKEPDKVPVVIQAYSMILKSIVGVTEYRYLHDLDIQIKAKVGFQRMFPEVLNVPEGILPEYAEIGLVPTAFGGKLAWFEDAPPYISEYPIKTPEDVDRLKEAGIPDPKKDGVTPEILKRLEYFCDHFPKDLREKYGYIDGNIYVEGITEGAALAMGYDKFLLWMRLHPDSLHKWLDLSVEWLLRYCSAVENIVGPCKTLFVPDHSPSMVGKEFFNEFMLPYFNRIFSRYDGALRIWHNEGRVGHMMDSIDKIEAEVWHFGFEDDPVECKKNTHFCLMGNIHPPWLVQAKPHQVEEASKKLISAIGEGGGLWLSTGGGIAPETPIENLKSLVTSVDKYGKYPISKT